MLKKTKLIERVGHYFCRKGNYQTCLHRPIISAIKINAVTAKKYQKFQISKINILSIMNVLLNMYARIIILHFDSILVYIIYNYRLLLSKATFRIKYDLFDESMVEEI